MLLIVYLEPLLILIVAFLTLSLFSVEAMAFSLIILEIIISLFKFVWLKFSSSESLNKYIM